MYLCLIPVMADEPPITLESIRKVWEAREKSVESFSASWNHLSRHVLRTNEKDLFDETLPPTSFGFPVKMQVNGKLLRVESQHDNTPSVYAHTVFDGKDRKELSFDEFNTPTRGYIAKNAKSMDLSFAHNALLFVFRPISLVNLTLDKKNFQLESEIVNIDGQKAVIVKQYNQHQVYWLAVDRAFVPIQIHGVNPNKPQQVLSKLIISYEDNQNPHLPTKWESSFYTQDSRLYIQENGNQLKFEKNAKIPDETFKLEFPKDINFTERSD